MPRSTKTRGRIIKEARELRGLTQSQVARAVDVEPQAVSLWENDKVGHIHPENLMRLVDLLGIEPEAIGYHAPLPAGEEAPLWAQRHHEEVLERLDKIVRLLKHPGRR